MQNSECRIQNSEFKNGSIYNARQISQIAKREGFISELNGDVGLVEIFDNELNKVAEGIRIYV